MRYLELRTVRCSDRRDAPLRDVSELWVRAALDCPAVAMHAVAAVDAPPGELAEARVLYEGRPLFAGAVDSQRFSVCGRGRLLELDARSKGAALLDNEALPCTLQGPTMTTVFRLFAEPYGFVLYNPAPAGGLGAYTVRKGCCEWDALCGFARRVYGRTPYVDGDVLAVERPPGDAPLVIGGAGHAYTRLEHTFRPYSLLSKVVLRGEDGAYHLAVDSAEAAYYRVRRKRYVIPPDEFCDAPGLDANQRIRRGLLGKEGVEAVLPGVVRAKPGQEARVLGEAMPRDGWLVSEALYRQDRGGVTTTLTLVKAAYLD